MKRTLMKEIIGAGMCWEDPTPETLLILNVLPPPASVLPGVRPAPCNEASGVCIGVTWGKQKGKFCFAKINIMM